MASGHIAHVHAAAHAPRLDERSIGREGIGPVPSSQTDLTHSRPRLFILNQVDILYTPIN